MKLKPQRPDVIPPGSAAVGPTEPPAGYWPGVFLGSGPSGPLCAGAEQAVLVLGPPRSGKTTSVVVPTVLTARGAVVATSTKTDVLSTTLRSRSGRGRCWLFDPSGTVTVPDGVTRLSWSPVIGCDDWGQAVATAHVLARAARPGRGLVDGDHWTERAEALLAPLLHAAALAGLDIGWVLRWVLRREITEPSVMLARRRGNQLAGETLAGIGSTEERERSGIFSTAAGVLAAYRSPSALEVAAKPNIDIEAFVRSSDTIYVTAPGDAQGQLAPLVVALLDRIRRATYSREAGWPTVVWALDEAANIAPIPTLPSVVSEGGSQGLLSLVCLQDLSQAHACWGRAADGFLSLFGWKMILPGIADYRTLQLVSALAGEMEVLRESKTTPTWFATNTTPTVTRHWERQAALPINQVNQQPPGTALVIGPNTPVMRVRLVPAWEYPWKDHTTP